MMINQRIVDTLLKKLRNEKYYDEVMKIALRNTYDKIYLVGGKVYRGLAEIIHERDMGFKDCDWDILVLGKPKKQWLPPVHLNSQSWSWKRSSYNTCFSLKCNLVDWSVGMRGSSHATLNTRSETLAKLDIVSIDDVKEHRPGAHNRRGTLDDYWWGVPLDIQAIALDLDTCVVTGKGIDSILKKRIQINNTTGTLQGKIYDDHYVSGMLEQKGMSMAFDYHSPGNKNSKGNCMCYKDDPRMLLYYGCHCGGN